MLVTFYCDHCEAKLRINADAMGSELICPECEAFLSVPRMQLGPGFVVGGFLIKHKLGEGGMGEVYLAKQLSLERDVALKILPSRFTRENSFVVRFLKEVHYQAKLDHPNIVTAYDAGEDGGVYFMAMAYVPGQTLEEWLDREGTLSEKDALQVVRQVAKALEYASVEKGILHRDIKPANIMLTPSLHAKVLDMGLSKNTLEKQSTTLADTLMGTPNYMSPEQIDHPQDLDTRSDMFSLGMTLYHMLTGQIPFEESGYLKTLQRHAREKLEDPRDLMPGITQGAAHLLARMLARNPEDRYPDWQRFLDDLHLVSSHKGIPEVPEGESTLDLNPPPAPEKTKVVVHESPNPHRSSIPPPRKRSAEGVILSVIIGLILGVGGILVLASQRTNSRPITPALPTPVISVQRPATPTPLPEIPTVNLADLQQELTSLILNYERTRDNHDQVIKDLSDVGLRAANTSVSEAAAQQIARVRQDRDRALEAELTRMRDETIRLLYKQGPEAARAFLNQYKGPFEADLQTLFVNLRRRIQAWERQERSQQEANLVLAQKGLDDLYKRLAPLMVKREWPQALSMVKEAAEEPTLFPVSSEVAALREELLALQAVPDLILKSYANQLNQEVILKLYDRDLPVKIREVKSDGLLVGRTVYAEDGSSVGSAELFIAFSMLSSMEVQNQLELMEGPEIMIYRALIANRNGEREVSRALLEELGSPLALALRNELFSLPTLGNPFLEVQEPDRDLPFNKPRFVPLPNLELP
jgi:serine/threonine protein kinase